MNNLQLKFFQKIVDQQLNVRETDEMIKQFLEKSEDEEKKKKRPKPKFISKDIRIATNTIRRSLKMIEDTGIKVESEEEEFDDYYQITIRVKKKTNIMKKILALHIGRCHYE